MNSYPKRLIEVDLPIARISAHARREKSIRHGHISTLHIWWARRPLAACRTVILASLWPDPVDLTAWLEEADGSEEIRAPKNKDLKPGEGVVIRPKRFLDEARSQMVRWSRIGVREDKHPDGETLDRLLKIQSNPKLLDDPEFLRTVLLDFIADFANWDNSTDADYLDTSRALVHAAHESLGGEAGSRPMVIDPFAGGGSIPLEAIRVGADAFASDLNPIPVLLNKVVLEYIPKYGQTLANEVSRWGQWVRERAANDLVSLYATGDDQEVPVAYLWARTILSEAPGADGIPTEVPLLRSMWISKKAGQKVALRWVSDGDGAVATDTVTTHYYIDGTLTPVQISRPKIEVFRPERDSEVSSGTVSRGHATCPVTGYTTRVDSVRTQLRKRSGGAQDSRLYCVVYTSPGEQGRKYRTPTATDESSALDACRDALQKGKGDSGLPLGLPEENSDAKDLFNNSAPIYGMTKWRDFYTPRQLLALGTLSRCIREARKLMASESSLEPELCDATTLILAMALGRAANQYCSLSKWNVNRQVVDGLFARQAIPMLWDYGELANPTRDGGYWEGALGWAIAVINACTPIRCTGEARRASATQQAMPDDAAHALVTDPPYYYSVQYAGLSDFFYVWLRRILAEQYPALFASDLVDNKEEIVVSSPQQANATTGKNKAYYESQMQLALADSRRVLSPSGIGVVVFAHMQTQAWESFIRSVIDAGFVITACWPIDTELSTRILAARQITLGSSIHIVCRPREHPDGTVRESDVGEWREVLSELPERMRAWMPRLAAEGIVGADAVFACLGPALELFSQFSRVERASGEEVQLHEYLEEVWAAVSNVALSMIFKDADAASLEPAARLTAMWLWTVGASAKQEADQDGEQVDDDNEKTISASFAIEFDAARKIAQGLGVHLEHSTDIVEVKGDTARLLPVAERIRHLFGKEATEEDSGRGRRNKKATQRSLFEELEAIEAETESGNGRFGGLDAAQPGATVLDKVHQSMVFFASGRGEALRRFLVDDGVGKDGKFWKLAQALSALYPNGTDEKR